MNDLNLGPNESGSRAKYFVVALVVLAIVAAAVFYFNPRKTAELHVTNVQTYVYTGEAHEVKGAGNVIGQATTAEHDLYVIATLRIDNKLRLPLFINGIGATYTATDGSERQAHATTASDLVRLEEIFPDLKAMLPHPLDLTNTITPQSSEEGQVLIEFPGFTNDIWKQRKSATLTVYLTHQTPQTIIIP